MMSQQGHCDNEIKFLRERESKYECTEVLYTMLFCVCKPGPGNIHCCGNKYRLNFCCLHFRLIRKVAYM